MTKTRSYFTASKKSKIAIAAVEGKLTQAQITSDATQIKAWKQTALKAIDDVFSGAHEKDKKVQEQLIDDLYQEIGRLQAQLSWLKKWISHSDNWVVNLKKKLASEMPKIVVKLKITEVDI